MSKKNNTPEKTIGDILPKELSEHLSPESLKVIEEHFRELVEAEINAKINLALETSRAVIDSSYNEKLVKLVNTIDSVHKKTLGKILENVDNKYKTEIKGIKNKFNRILKEDSVKFKNDMIINLNKFLDDKIDTLMPTKTLQEACRNRVAHKALSAMREVLSVNDISTMETLKAPILEAKRMIKERDERIEGLISENENSKKMIEESQKIKFLESKTKSFDDSLKSYVKRIFKHCPVKFMEEHFDYVVKQYSDTLEDKRTILKEEETSRRNGKTVHNMKNIMNATPKKHGNSNENGINQVFIQDIINEELESKGLWY